MKKNRKQQFQLSHPAPLAVRETSISAYRDETDWTVETSDPTEMRHLERKGYEPFAYDGTYVRYRLARRAITIRSRAAVDHPHQRKNLPRLDRRGDSRTAASPKVGKSRTSDSRESSGGGPNDLGGAKASNTPPNSANLDDARRPPIRAGDRHRSQS